MLVIYSVVAVAITFLASSATELPMKMTAYAFAVHRCYKRPLPSTMERYLNNNKDNARQRRRNNEYSSESRLLPRLPMATQSNHDNATQTSNSKFNVDQDVEHSNDDSLIDDEEENTDEEMIDMLLSPPQIDNFDMDDEDIQLLSPTEVQSMTIPQLKQQLRLRGKKVSGTKSQLIERLLGGSSGSFETARNDDGGGGSSSMEVGTKLPRGYTKYDKSMRRKVKGSGDDSGDSSDEEDAVKVKPKKRGRAVEVAESQKVVIEAKAKGANIVDVTDFIEATEVGNDFRSSDTTDSTEYHQSSGTANGNEGSTSSERDDATPSSSSSTEVWGEDARIVEDYEGRSVVVDGLSRTVIEYKGSGDATVQAYVVASRDSLRNFLRSVGGGVGGDATGSGTTKTTPVYSSTEEEVYAIQRKREAESSRGLIRPDEVEGQEDSTDAGKYYDTIERDYGDWGVYTPTGAQLSSAEVQGVLLLSDVYGPFTENTRALADKIAFECQPVVVLAPDLFRGRPWSSDTTVAGDGVERDRDGKTFEEWRSTHPERRVDVDIRAAAAVLRERYAVSSIAVWGTCYGGGRALEAAAGWYAGGPSSYYEDALSERPPPPHVDPVAAVIWYPTRYNARKLFGRTNEGFRTFESGKDRSVAILAVFAENDSLPGATPKDAMLLKECLDEDSRVKDFMVKVFPDQKHGFAHANLGGGVSLSDIGHDAKQEGIELVFGDNYGSNMEPLDVGGDAEVACLLSTAWMETYTRVFLPTVGAPVKFDADERWSTLEMDGHSQTKKGRREVQAELEEAIANFEGVDVDLRRMTQTASPLLDGPGSKEYEQIEEERELLRQQILEKYDISEDDDEETFERKFQKAKEDGALNQLLLDAYMDGDAYW